MQMAVCIVVVIVQSLSCVQFFATPWTAAHQAPLSMEFSRKEYFSGLPFPFPGAPPSPGIKPASSALQILYPLSHQGSPLRVKSLFLRNLRKTSY